MEYRLLLSLLGLLLTVGCLFGGAEKTPQTVGLLQAETPMETPIGRQPACAVNLYWSGTNRSTSDRLYGHYTPTRYSPDATLEVDGKVYSIVGSGGKSGEKQAGERWFWRWTVTDGKLVKVAPPEALYGWEDALDTLLNRIAGRGTQTLPPAKTLTVVERYIPCGQMIGIRGEIIGDSFHVEP